MDQQQPREPAQLLTWLDEQRREDRRQLAALQTLAESQGRELDALTQRFEDLERRLTGTQAQLSRFTEIEAALQAVKDEILVALKQSETRLRATDSQLESRLEAQAAPLANLAKALEGVQGSLTALQNEIETVPSRMDSQAEQVTGLARDIADLEERFTQTHARLVQLSERLSNQADSTASLARQLEFLEGRLSNTQAQLVKFPQIEAAIQETANELVFMIKELEEQHNKEARESAQLREAEHKDIRVALDRLETHLEPIPRLAQRIKELAVEDERLRNLITAQEQRIPPLLEHIDEHRERISYLEEARPRISRRIDELEVQIPPLYEVDERHAAKIQFLEEWAQRSAERIDELKRFEDQIARWRADFIEEIRQGEKHRDRRLTDWEKALKEHEALFDDWREILRRYEIGYRDSLRIVDDLQELAQRLERDQAEVMEQQRLADERLQRELEAWQEENEKRWHLFLKQRDYDWEQVAKQDTEQDCRLDELEAWRVEITAQIAEELDRLDENDRRVLVRIVSLIRTLDEAVEQQVKHYAAQRPALNKELEASDVLVGRSRAERRPGHANQRPVRTQSKE